MANMLFAQEEIPFIKEGNKAYRIKDYKLADSLYNKALEKKYDSPEAMFNLGNTHYQVGVTVKELLKTYPQLAQQNPEKFKEGQELVKQNLDVAQKQYEDILKQGVENKIKKAKALHNLGNTHVQQEDYKKAIEKYKDALRNNPTNEDTRYNLAYAQKKLKEQQNNGGGNGNQQQNDQNQDKNKDKENDQDGEQEDNQEGNQNDNQNGEEQDDQNKDGREGQNNNQQQGDNQSGNERGAKQNQLTKEQAEKFLQALMQQEQALQDKNGKKKKGIPVRIEKDW